MADFLVAIGLVFALAALFGLLTMSGKISCAAAE